MSIRLLLDAALDLIYPRIYCISCGQALKPGAPHELCENCSQSLPFIQDPKCIKCGKPLSIDDIDLDFCPDCRHYEHQFQQGISVLEYNTSVHELVYRYKYYKEFGLNRTLGFFMLDALKKTDWQPDLIIPIPLHKNRQKSRGFNQAALLGDYLERGTGIPCLSNILIRSIDTKTQTGFSRWERAQNLENAFTVIAPRQVEDKNILLVDDIYTTGATVDSCSIKLKEAGAKNIYVLTFATGRNT